MAAPVGVVTSLGAPALETVSTVTWPPTVFSCFDRWCCICCRAGNMGVACLPMSTLSLVVKCHRRRLVARSGPQRLVLPGNRQCGAGLRRRTVLAASAVGVDLVGSESRRVVFNMAVSTWCDTSSERRRRQHPRFSGLMAGASGVGVDNELCRAEVVI
jgi:hypothetical protein